MHGLTAWVLTAVGSFFPAPPADEVLAQRDLREAPPLMWIRPAEEVVPAEEHPVCGAYEDSSSRRRQIAWSIAAGLGAFAVGISWGRWLEGVPDPETQAPAAEEDEPEPPTA
ncbi:MAG: hypothetical protein AAFU79_05290 [Myxococcota bacterium]